MDIEMLDTKKKQNIYKMWTDNKFVENLEKRGPKVPSFAFNKKDDSETPEQTLIRMFGINNEDNKFSEKYQQAISGDGKEEDNILTYHSSALCALLHFYNVEKEGIKININKKEIIFNKSYFEWKNKVIHNPSNVDIVLISKDGKKVLFLESKFSEYLDESQWSKSISNVYLKNKYSKVIYEDLFRSIFVKEEEKDKDNFKIKLKDSTKRYYYDGIKQMISHYVGIKNIICDKNNKIKEYNEKLIKEKKDIMAKVEVIYLGTILYDGFDFPKFKRENNSLERYRYIYKKLYETMKKYSNEEKQKVKFEIINEILTYSEVFNNNENSNKVLDKNVRQFYYRN